MRTDARDEPQPRAIPDDLERALVAYIDATSVKAAGGGTSGGWAAVPGRTADPESTAWVLVARARAKEVAPAGWNAARDWLLARQRPDGSWVMRDGADFSTWPTLVALFAISLTSRDIESNRARERATTWALDEHSVTPSLWSRFLMRMLPQGESEAGVVLDATLDGFGWARGTFAWVEPTAMAMLALARQDSFADLKERVSVGARLLADRQSPDGGWNYGNKRVLGYDLPGYPDTTCWALLGLQAAVRSGAMTAAVAGPVATRGFALLSGGEPRRSTLTLSLETLARRAWADSSLALPDNATRIPALRTAVAKALEAQHEGYPMLETRTAVLALLALREVSL
ncbi:MAG: prenyltransferase/squalene oxidase repeat-containing protein [Gemmatimonadota bacterium]